MEEFVINPENYKEEYIKNLNECFNGWGGDREYNWVFDRKVGEHSADILLIRNDEDGVIAGSGISYRKLSNKTTTFEVGIMTGSWTLPAARKKGCFTKMIRCSKDLCEQKEVPYLTAFVTETNPSARRLEAEGSHLVPTYHLFSPEVPFEEEDLPEVNVLQKSNEVYEKVFDRMQESQRDFLNFEYSFVEFKGQYLERIKETTLLKLKDDFAVLENGENEIKILLLTTKDDKSLSGNIKALVNWCLSNRSMKAFFFSTRKEFLEVCQELDFEVAPGFFTVLSSSERDLKKEDFRALNINMGDKM